MRWVLTWYHLFCFNYVTAEMINLRPSPGGNCEGPNQQYFVEAYQVFTSTQDLYDKYDSLDGESRKNARVFGGKEYELERSYNILAKRKDCHCAGIGPCACTNDGGDCKCKAQKQDEQK